jgi:hypothetical protein
VVRAARAGVQGDALGRREVVGDGQCQGELRASGRDLGGGGRRGRRAVADLGFYARVTTRKPVYCDIIYRYGFFSLRCSTKLPQILRSW